MPLSRGAAAPDFALPGTHGSTFSLHRDAAGQRLVLYFYPKDFSPLCTAEACAFRDEFAHLRALDVAVYGISDGSPAVQARFREQLHLPFHLLADTERRVAGAYEAVIPVLGLLRRVTYVLVPQGSTHRIAAVYENNFGASGHLKAALAALAG